MALSPFDDVILLCREKAINTEALILKFASYGEEVEICFRTKMIDLLQACLEADDATFEFCNRWANAANLYSILYVIEACIETGQTELAQSIEKNVNKILANPQCYRGNPQLQNNVASFETKYRAMLSAKTLCTETENPKTSPSIKGSWLSETHDSNKRSIFISYCWRCRPYDVHKLAEMLKAYFNVWLDKDEIRGGDIYKAMANGIDNSDIVVVCFSEAYKLSESCYDELSYAKGQKKPIALVMMHGNIEKKGEFWLILRFIQYVEMYKHEAIADAYSKLVVNINHLLQQKEQKRFFETKPNMPKELYHRKAIEARVQDELEKTLHRPDLGALLVTGDEKVGKTTLVASILANFKTDTKFEGIVWTSCHKWCKNDERNEFSLQKLHKSILRTLSISPSAVAQLSDLGESKFFFVFDNVRSGNVLETIEKLVLINKLPAVIIMSSDACSMNEELLKNMTLNRIEITPWTDAELCDFLQNTCGLSGKIDNDTVKLFKGLPAVGYDWAQKAKNDFDAKVFLVSGDVAVLSVGRTSSKLRKEGVPRFEKYYSRKDDEIAIKKMLIVMAKDPTKGSGLILGAGGNGKSTLMANIIHSQENEKLFLNDLNVKVVLWLNCYHWNKQMSAEDRNSFIRSLLEMARKCIDDDKERKAAESWQSFSKMEEYFVQKLGGRLMIVLDDCFDSSAIETLRNQSVSLPCCVITRYRNVFSPNVVFVKPEITVQGLTESQILELLSETHQLKDELSTDKLMRLAHLSCGSPLLATLIAGQFTYGFDDDEKNVIFEDLIERNKLVELAHTAKVGDMLRLEEQKAHDIFNRAIEQLDKKKLDHYFAFLLLDPVTPIMAKDLTVFWQVSIKDAFFTLKQLVKMGLARDAVHGMEINDPLRAFMVHQILHEALTEKAKQHFGLQDLTSIRVAILTAHPQVHLIKANTTTKLVHELNRLFMAGLDDFVDDIVVLIDSAAEAFENLMDVAPLNEKHFVRETDGATLLHKLCGSKACVGLIRATILAIPQKMDKKLAGVLRDEEDRTPLACAAYNGTREVVEYLADEWPDSVKLVDFSGMTPLALAVDNGNREVVQYLATRWPELVTMQDGGGITPLAKAAENGNGEVVKMLATLCPQAVKVKDNRQRTPLAIAAESGKRGIVQYLAKKWPEAILMQDNEGLTPLALAGQRGHRKVYELLAKEWPDTVEIRDYSGRAANLNVNQCTPS